jgi:hypothetical protein
MTDEKQNPEKNNGNETPSPHPPAPHPEGDPLEREQQFVAERATTLGPKAVQGPPPIPPEPEGGPFERQRAFLTERFAVLGSKEAAPGDIPGITIPQALEILPEVQLESPLPADFRQKLLEQYRERQRRQLLQGGVLPGDVIVPADAPQQPPANNWIPIGPSVIRQGQGAVLPAVSGRTPAIAIAPGGMRAYAATANGGVWRSEDMGRSWRSLMDAFDLNPTNQGADSLACGAIALVAGATANQDRLYVGSGEGAGGAYLGVGPLLSTDGGANWNTEAVAPGSLPLAGSTFYALAVDPADPDRVVAATRRGIYRREPNSIGGFHWAQKTLPGAMNFATSVVAARSGNTVTFYAAPLGGPIYNSSDGHTWNALGNGFPTTNVGRIGLAVQANNPTVVYALIHNTSDGSALGIWRLDTSDNNWRQVTGHPTDLFGTAAIGFQGSYDLAIAVAPNNVNVIFLGGSTINSAGEWSGSLYRSVITSSGAGATLTYSMASTYIGASVHADIHTIVFAPGYNNLMWVGCDGGVFFTFNPNGNSNIFQARNTGLNTLTMNHIDQHPGEDAVLFSGTQDNGGARFTGEEVWLHSVWGDSGYFVIDWNNPYRALSTYVGASISRTTDGGTRYNYNNVNVPLAMDANGNVIENVLFYAPLVGTPPNPANPGEANLVAFGTERPWISTTFGGGWQSIPTGTFAGDRLIAVIRSLVFASATRFYAGTVRIQVTPGTFDSAVYRFDQSGANWTRTRIDTIGGANALPLAGVVTDIAVDQADPSGNSIYITFGGSGDYRHVWHFNGTQWQQRSGPAAGNANSLLDVQHNAIVVDPANPTDLYVGADIGVWRSTDSGVNWQPFSQGLPDAAVLDLKLHNARRLLRAATHGRGVFERTLDNLPKQGVDLYVRDTQLDQGRFATIDGLNDPTQQGQTVSHTSGPDIKLDTPDNCGKYQFPQSNIDFYQFIQELIDNSGAVAIHATTSLNTRVYVQVHNRGVIPANNVRVMLLLANYSGALPALPAGYAAAVQTGTTITAPGWTTVGQTILNDVRTGFPRIATFNLNSNTLTSGNNHCVLALIHHADDPFTATETNVDTLSVSERKTAHKNLSLANFTGTAPVSPLSLRAIAIAAGINPPLSVRNNILPVPCNGNPESLKDHLYCLRSGGAC